MHASRFMHWRWIINFLSVLHKLAYSTCCFKKYNVAVILLLATSLPQTGWYLYLKTVRGTRSSSAKGTRPRCRLRGGGWGFPNFLAHLILRGLNTSHPGGFESAPVKEIPYQWQDTSPCPRVKYHPEQRQMTTNVNSLSCDICSISRPPRRGASRSVFAQYFFIGSGHLDQSSIGKPLI